VHDFGLFCGDGKTKVVLKPVLVLAGGGSNDVRGSSVYIASRRRPYSASTSTSESALGGSLSLSSSLRLVVCLLFKLVTQPIDHEKGFICVEKAHSRPRYNFFSR